MLSFKNNQNVQPLYDYYVETDLDSFDDQPVDYSKKYSDQDSYEERRRAKSTLKSSEIPSEVSQTLKQTSNDEVKVYCIEGTPLAISYASSLSDLREVGINCPIDKPEDKNLFPSVNEDGISDLYSDDSKKTVELLDANNEELSVSKEKEGKSVSFRNSTDISKASSPLMFSRSSSIGSLTSFEQQSIVDDRSSVSVFSALTSGLISPSDLPDSPGELMSPTLTDKDSNSKIENIDVTKIDSDNELEKEDIHSAQVILNDENEIQLPETKVHDPLDLNKSSEDDNEVIALQLETSNDSLDEVFENPDSKKNTSFSLKNDEELSCKSDEELDDDDFLLQQCIELGMPSSSSKSKPNQKMEMSKKFVVLKENLACDKDEGEKPVVQNEECNSPKVLPDIISSDSIQVETKFVDPLKSDDDSGEDDELLQSCIQLGMPENTSNKIVPNPEVFVKPVYSSYSEKVETKFVDPLKSDDDSGEDDELLQSCIQLGMPESTSNKIVPNPEVFVKPVYSSYSEKVETKFVDPLKSDDDSGEDDELLQSCIQLGMPENTSNKIVPNPEVFVKPVYSSYSEKVLESDACAKPDVDLDAAELLLQECIELGMPKELPVNSVSSLGSKTVECLPADIKINSPQQYPIKDTSRSYQPPHPKINNIMPSSYQQYRMPMSSKAHYNGCGNNRPVNIKQAASPAKKTLKNAYRKTSAIKSAAGYCDENEILLQHVIEMGVPKDLSEKKNLHSGILRPELSTSQFLFNHDMRDNCPDGISDGDEEDTILETCINAGMPSPKFARNVPNRLPVQRIKHACHQKQPITPRPVIPGVSSESNKKSNPITLPLNQPYASIRSNGFWISSTSFIDIDSMRVYQTEDTPVLSPTASVSDLSSLSINESFLNNSRNSDCSESDDDDELLQQCIRSGMPEAKRAVA